MLEAPRADIEADLKRGRIAWREDATNAEPTYTRNRVRSSVVPALLAACCGATTPAARASLARRAARLSAELRDAERALSGRVTPLTANAITEDVPSIALAALSELGSAERRLFWRALWRRLVPTGPGLTAAHLAQLERLMGRARGPVALPGYVALRRNQSVRLLRAGIQARNTTPEHGVVIEWSSPLRVPGSARGAGLRIAGGWTTRRRALDQISVNAGSEEYFDAEGVQGGLVVRSARTGDEFVPFGRQRPVRLHEFLKRLPERHRSSPPTVLADERGILWVIGVRRSARAPVRPTTRRVLRVHAERHD
jgi:tRNA(Ile)-lysidine synthase